MSKKLWTPLLLLCLLLAACSRVQSDSAPAPAPESPEPSPLPPAHIEINPLPEPVFLDHLTIEVVVDWSEADRILSQMDTLSRLVGEALEEAGCTVEDQITITIGTAGGITAQALSEGGVDAAILPSADYEEIEDKASAVLHSAGSGITAAVTQTREELDENFQRILSSALLETAAGKEFLEICYPGTTFAGANTQLFTFDGPASNSDQ